MLLERAREAADGVRRQSPTQSIVLLNAAAAICHNSDDKNDDKI